MSGAPDERAAPAETESDRGRRVVSGLATGAGVALLVATLGALAWLLSGS